LVKICEARYIDVKSRQPYASEWDLMASTVPFLIEHKISGELLGLSGLLSLDCYDYLRCIMFDLKVQAEPEPWHRLAPVGYALVFESVRSGKTLGNRKETFAGRIVFSIMFVMVRGFCGEDFSG